MNTLGAIREWRRWAEAGGLSPRTAKTYAGWIAGFFTTHELEYDEVDLQTLVVWASGIGGGSSRGAYHAMRSFYRYLIAAGHASHDPAVHMPYVPQGHKVPAAFEPEELERVLSAGDSIEPRIGNTLRFLYSTGARVSEAAAVRLDDVTPRAVLLRETKRKPGGLQRERSIPMSDVSRAAVAGLKLTSRKGLLVGVSRQMIWKWCSWAERETGLRVHPHKFRATFATHMLTRGVDVRTVQELMGHESIETTMRYLSDTDARLEQAVTVLG